MKLTHQLIALGLGLGLSAGPAYPANEAGKKEATTQSSEKSSARDTDQAQETPIVVTQVWTVYLDRLEKEAVTVTFPKGSSELSADDQARLRELVPAWQKDKDIDKVIVAAWSDLQYPKQQSTRLPESARDLAEKRADRIEDFVEKLGVADVDTFSMAEKPNWFQKVLHTDAAQIKGEAKDMKVDSLNEDRIHRILDSKGGPSKAVIILKRNFDPQRQAS
ncbi:MAG: hypothetical protein M3Q07_03475 [Pseudobdellovibrionaceae bacterium]|nr:hypothetical protein [Pseudobdellovibrionaceae bacterium]